MIINVLSLKLYETSISFIMTLNEQSSTKERVVLELLGIDKKWVRAKDGTWVDMATLPKQSDETIENQPETTEKKKKKWWKFW